MIIAVDTGGTKTLIASFGETGDKTILGKFPTPRDQNEYLDQVIKTISDSDVSNLRAIVVAIPGPIRNGIVQRTPNIGWQNFDVLAAIRPHFPDVILSLGNDADLAGISEARELEDPKLCVYLTLSTGVGTGLTYNGHPLPQLERFEGGSMRVEYDGQRDRYERIASGKSFYERYHKFGAEITDPDIWRNYAERAASGLMALIPLLEPNNIVIGGSMGTHFPKYSSFLMEILNNKIAKHMPDVKLSQAKHPEEAVIYGCYYRAKDILDRE